MFRFLKTYPEGKIVARIVEMPNESSIEDYETGKTLGRYYKGMNITVDSNGRTVSQGNVLESLALWSKYR